MYLREDDAGRRVQHRQAADTMFQHQLGRALQLAAFALAFSAAHLWRHSHCSSSN
jgi:hypothetical protein